MNNTDLVMMLIGLVVGFIILAASRDTNRPS